LEDEVKLEKVKKPKGVMWLKHLKPNLFIFITIFCWEILFFKVMIPPPLAEFTHRNKKHWEAFCNTKAPSFPT